MDEDFELVSSRLTDLAKSADKYNSLRYSWFLSLPEQNILEMIMPKLRVPCMKFGGFAEAERIMAGFGFNIDNEDFPIKYVLIEPKNKKYQGDLTHRDFLGSVLGLGIKREVIGDILVKNGSAVLVVQNDMSDYIRNSLSTVKRTEVKCSVLDSIPADLTLETVQKKINVASERPDSIIAAAMGISRSIAVEYIKSGKVFVNGKELTSSAHHLKEGDRVSVRGLGKFRFCGTEAVSKKGRLFVLVEIYK